MAVLFAVMSPVGVVAQRVSVVVSNDASSEPIAGAIVYLVTESGAEVGRALTDERGAVLFFRSGLGNHVIRAEMIGMAVAESEVFSVNAGESITLRLRLEASPIELEGLGVEAAERCRTGPQAGLVAAQVWEEARKALTAMTLTEEAELYRFQTMLYEQDLDRETRIIRRSRRSEREATMRVPFRSRPVDDLVRYGFVERSGNMDLYLAPDANVLLSRAFLDAHCFRVRSGPAGSEADGLVGLSFEPTPERGHLPEISGTLWIDPTSSELRWLEFRYVNLDPVLASDEVGGRVDFRRMPDGGWIIPEWRIRMPRMARQGTLSGYDTRTYLAGFTEAGGVVLEVQGAGRILGHEVTGAMDGVVRDSLGRRRGGARVTLRGTEYSTVSDSLGNFALFSLLEGVYELDVVDPRLEVLGFPPATTTWAVVNGEATLVEVQVPSATAALYGSCAGSTRPPEWRELAREYPGEGIVYGRVIDGVTNKVIAGAPVRIMTPTVAFEAGRSRTSGSGVSATLGGVDVSRSELIVRQGSVGLMTETNEKGFFRFCGLPEGHRINLVAVVDGVEIGVDEFRIPDAGGFVEQEIRTRRAPR